MKHEKRRQRGTGSIFQKPPNKNYFIQFYKKGKRIREGTGSADFDVARKLLRQRLHEIDQNEYVKRVGRPARVSDLYDALKLERETNRKGRARELPNRWAHLEPEFGPVLAAEVTTDDVRRYISARQKAKAANATINRELATLKRMFRLALQSTPPKLTRIPYIPLLKEDNTRTGFVEDADYARLVSHAGELWLRLFLELAYSYGWRRGELLGLRVRQVNLPNRTIRLDPGTTKNKEGREVVMTGQVFELLREATARKKPDDFVLTRKGGGPVKEFRRTWGRLCERAGLGRFVCRKCAEAVPGGGTCKKCGGRRPPYRGLIPHDLRRSAAKAARRAGVPESVVMKMGGWKTAAMFRRYAIDSSADQRAAAEAVERARATALAPETAPFPSPGPIVANLAKPN